MHDLLDRYFASLAQRPTWWTALIAAICVVDLFVVITGNQAPNVRIFNGTLAGIVLVLMTVALIRRFRGA